jgi:hypothetical protein
MVCLVCDFQIQSTRADWIDVPEHLSQAAIDAFKSNRSAMQGVSVASPSLSIDTFRALSAYKAFRVLFNGYLAPASPALLLLLRRGVAFVPATLDDCIIEELEELDELNSTSPATHAPAKL